MRRSIWVVALLLTFLIGCSTNDSPLSVETDQTNRELLKLPSAKKDNSTSSQFIVSQEIIGSQGGVIPFDFTLSGGIKVQGQLYIPEKAFNSTETITIIFDDEYAVADFYPSPYKFDKPLLLTYTYEGIPLQGINVNDLGFYYIAGTGDSEIINSKQIIFSNSTSQLGIVEAELEHFSRFGWTK